MLTREENEKITRVGPGTPAGELLRRYWFPVGVASELTAESPRGTGARFVLRLPVPATVTEVHDPAQVAL